MSSALIPFPPLSLSPLVWGELGAPSSPPLLCPCSSQHRAGTRWRWDGRSDLSAETPSSTGRAVLLCVLQMPLYLRCSMTTVTVGTQGAELQECPGSLLLARERDGGARTCSGAATRAGDGSLSPKTLPVLRDGPHWGSDWPCSSLPGLFRVELLAQLNFLLSVCCISVHPPRLAPPPSSAPSSSHPQPPPQAFPFCCPTAVLRIMITTICC